MNFVAQPPSDRNGAGAGIDDLDETLFAFFRSALPRPWPALSLPERAPSFAAVRPAVAAPAVPARSWFRSPRFALAASVALLIAGYALMSAALAPPTVGDNSNLHDGRADRRPNQRVMDPSLAPPDDDVELRSWLEVDGNKPATFHIQASQRK